MTPASRAVPRGDLLERGRAATTPRGGCVIAAFVFTTFTRRIPCTGMDELMGLAHSRLPIVTLVGGVAGCATALAMQFYMAVFDWPLNVGGKPLNSTLAFVPITFELTVLCAGLLTAAAFLTRSRLAPGARAAQFAEGTTEDVFALVLRRRDATFDADEVRRLLFESGAAQVALKEVTR